MEARKGFVPDGWARMQDGFGGGGGMGPYARSGESRVGLALLAPPVHLSLPDSVHGAICLIPPSPVALCGWTVSG